MFFLITLRLLINEKFRLVAERGLFQIIIIIIWDFNIQTDHLIPARRWDLIIINKKKRICKIVDFAVLADHRINLKEYEKKD